jgi:hypothetical protein
MHKMCAGSCVCMCVVCVHIFISRKYVVYIIAYNWNVRKLQGQNLEKEGVGKKDISCCDMGTNKYFSNNNLHFRSLATLIFFYTWDEL